MTFFSPFWQFSAVCVSRERKEINSSFSLRSTEIGWSESVEPTRRGIRVGTDNTQFCRKFRVWRRKASERSSTFSLRFTTIGGSVFVGPRLKVGVLVKGNAWTPKSRIFVEDSSGSSGRPWVSDLRDSKKFRLPSKR